MREGLRDTLTRMAGAAPGPRAPWTLLWGIAGTGKTEISARLAAHAGQPLLAFDAMAADKTARLELLRLAQRDALALGATLYVGPLAVSDNATALVRRLDAYSGAYPGPVFLGVESSRPPNLRLDRPLREVELGLPDERGRAVLWQRAVGGGSPEATDGGAADGLSTLARSFHSSPGEILATGREAQA